MSSSQPLPAKPKMPRSPQNNNYQQQQQTNQYSHSTQPSGGNPPMFKPSYRPSYTPNQSSSNNTYNPEPAAPSSGNSMKIDLGSLGLDFGFFNSKTESENNFTSTAPNTQQTNPYGGAPDTSFPSMENTYGDLNSTNMEKKDSFNFNFDSLDFPSSDFPMDLGQPVNGNVVVEQPVKNVEPAATTSNFNYNPPPTTTTSETKIDLSAINKPQPQPAVYEPPTTTKMVVEEPKPKPEPVKSVVTQPPVVQAKPKETVPPPQEKAKPKPVASRSIWETGEDDDDEIFSVKIPKKEASQQQAQESVKKIEPVKMEIEKSLKPAILNSKPKEGGDLSKTLEQPKMEKKPSKSVVFEELPEKSSSSVQKSQEKTDDYSVQRSSSEKSTFNAPSLKQKSEIEKPKFKMSSDKTSGAAPTKRASEPPVETAPLNEEIDHDQVLSGLLEDIQSSQNDLHEEGSRENSNRSTFVKPKGDDEDSNRTPKGSSAKKINLLTTKSGEKEKERKPVVSDEKPKISISKPKPRIEEEEEEEEEYDDDDEETLYSEPIPKKDRGERVEEEGSRIRFDIEQIKKDFETMRRSKVPRDLEKII